LRNRSEFPPAFNGVFCEAECRLMAVRREGANHWRKIPP
jgi:hypothetical protein